MSYEAVLLSFRDSGKQSAAFCAKVLSYRGNEETEGGISFLKKNVKVPEQQ
jgi:hypothetical protein